MLKSRTARLGALSVAALAAFGATATAAGPPTPVSTSGKKVESVGTVPTPTSFAFSGNTAFVGGFGDESNPSIQGGIFVLKGGKATLVPGTAGPVFGLAAHKGKLYSTSGKTLNVWSWWNGTKFAHHKVLFTGPKRFSALNGVAWGPDNRLYAGVSLDDNGDHGPPKTPYEYSLLSFKPNGKDLKVV
ncbi:MAG TPA: hypothetical protein VGI54_02860, partial [Solirubrobacteraceae bacterium]